LVDEQLHRTFQVGEQHGDLLALAFERAPRRQDLLGEVLWYVGLRRDRRSRAVRISRDSAAASKAESRPGWKNSAARGAAPTETRPASDAELCIRWVRAAAARAGHDTLIVLAWPAPAKPACSSLGTP